MPSIDSGVVNDFGDEFNIVINNYRVDTKNCAIAIRGHPMRDFPYPMESTIPDGLQEFLPTMGYMRFA